MFSKDNGNATPAETFTFNGCTIQDYNNYVLIKAPMDQYINILLLKENIVLHSLACLLRSIAPYSSIDETTTTSYIACPYRQSWMENKNKLFLANHINIAFLFLRTGLSGSNNSFYTIGYFGIF